MRTARSTACYGTLGLALLLFCLRAMNPERIWNEKMLAFAFWTINGGLLLMMVGSLLPIGLMQTVESVRHGYWSARSTEFMQTPLMQNLRWARVFGDSIFGLGAFVFVWFAMKLMLTKDSSR